MSTIERAAERLGGVGKVRPEPIAPNPAVPPRVKVVSDVATVPDTAAITGPGAGYCELDLASLTAQGFLTEQNGQSEIGADLRRIKRPLLLAIKKAEANAQNNLPPNVVLITSSLPGEGKTFVSINLALSLAAELDRSVLLVDADVAKSDVRRVLGIDARAGLTDLLQEPAAYPDNLVLQTNVPSLSLLPSGPLLPNVDELFASDRMTQLLRDLAQHDPNRIIVIDAPPLRAGTEASVLARMVGQVVMLVEADKTPQSTVTESMHQLHGCESVNLVLNKARRRGSETRGYGYGYGYGSAGS